MYFELQQSFVTSSVLVVGILNLALSTPPGSLFTVQG